MDKANKLLGRCAICHKEVYEHQKIVVLHQWWFHITCTIQNPDIYEYYFDEFLDKGSISLKPTWLHLSDELIGHHYPQIAKKINQSKICRALNEVNRNDIR